MLPRMRVNWVGVRNFAIIAGIAAIAVVWQDGADAIADALGTIIVVLFVAAIGVFAFNYFRQNQLAWLVMKPWQRWVVIICGVGIAFLLISLAVFPDLVDRVTPLGMVALIAVLALVIVWVIRESRRFRM